MENLDWKSISSFDDDYEINIYGEVRSVDKMIQDPKTGKMKWRKGRKLKACKNKKGSLQYVLIKGNGKRSTVRIYILMKEAGYTDNVEKYLAPDDKPDRGKIYEFLDPDGQYVKVENLTKFCKENELHVSNLNKVHSGKLRSSQGWKKFCELEHFK